MPTSPLQTAGATAQPSRFAPLYTNRYFTGLWTQRNPLRDAAVPHLYEKFYSASRFESLIDGLNAEVTARLTMARRAGFSPYNSQTFPAVTRFYAFKTFSPAGQVIKVIADTAGTVYDATGPANKIAFLNKAGGAGAASFLGVGNILYLGDGAEVKKWQPNANGGAPVPSWPTVTNVGTNYQGNPIGDQNLTNQGGVIIDSNNNLQRCYGSMVADAVTNGTITVQVLNGVLTITAGYAIRGLVVPGQVMRFESFDLATFLNGLELPISSIVSGGSVGIGGPIVFTCNIAAADYGPTVQGAGHIYDISQGTTGYFGTNLGVPGGVQPVWATVTGATTQDGQTPQSLLWKVLGPITSNWGITGPTTAPNVANALLPAPYNQWAASKFYSPSLLVMDNQVTPHLWKLTVAGTHTATVAWTKIDNAGHSDTTTGAPTGNAGDDTWVDQGQAAWQANHAYAVGQYIAAAFSRTITRRFRDPETGEINVIQIITNYSDLFKCTVAGTSGAAQPPWSSGLGSKVTDGASNPTLTWVNQGNVTTGDGHAVNGVASISIGANTALSLDQTIIDSNQELQAVYTAGKSAAAHPTWATMTGQLTNEVAGPTWACQGPFGTVQTQAQQYVYAYRNSFTKHKSSASPASAQIVVGLNSYINVTGQGSPDPQVDTVRIYRIPKGGSTFLYLADIPNPGGGQVWSYNDNSDDSALDLLTQAAINHVNDPPPFNAVAPCYHLSRIFVAANNVVQWSGGPDTFEGVGNESFPPANNFVFPSQVVRMWATSIGLLVFTTTDIYIILGRGVLGASPFYVVKFLEGYGLKSYDSIAVNGTTLYLITSVNKVVSLDPGAGTIEVGFPIGDVLNTGLGGGGVTPYLTWHEARSGESALFVFDGISSWYRMAATSAPESGVAWSPKGSMAAGLSAALSIETSPGVTQLLVGPPLAGGKILYRDPTVATDNLATFSWFGTFGSIVVAQPGAIAELAFITADLVKLGTPPIMNVLLGEIAGTFEALVASVQDPPDLAPSLSLFNLRYYFLQNQAPVYCRHLQLKVSFAAENAANELLSHTIFGALHPEKR